MRAALLFILIFLIAPSAHAHRPYVIKEGTISDPSGNLLILEKLYGDGIFTSDPVSFQIRSKIGALLAYTPTADHVAVFCPKINFCWAFPYGVASPFTTGYKLDHTSTDWNAAPQKLDLQGEEEELYKKYLSDTKQRDARSYSFGDPWGRKDQKGFIPSNASIIFSPLLIIYDQIIQLIVTILLSAFPFFLYWLFFKRYTPEKQTNKILIRGIGTVLILGYLLFYCLALFILGFTIGTPWLYMLAAMLLGIASPKLIRMKKKSVPEGA